MSISVAIEQLETTLIDYPWGYLVTVSDSGRAHLLSVPTQFIAARFTMSVGGGSRANATARPDVTLLFPPASGTQYSLIVDGVASVFDDRIEVTPNKAVLHRPAL